MDCPTQSNHATKTRCKISVSQPPGTDLRICASKGLHINLLQGWVFELLRNARKSLRLQPQGLQNYRTGKLEPEFTSQFGHLVFSWMQDLNLARWWTLGKLESVEGSVSWWWDWAQCPDAKGSWRVVFPPSLQQKKWREKLVQPSITPTQRVAVKHLLIYSQHPHLRNQLPINLFSVQEPNLRPPQLPAGRTFRKFANLETRPERAPHPAALHLRYPLVCHRSKSTWVKRITRKLGTRNVRNVRAGGRRWNNNSATKSTPKNVWHQRRPSMIPANTKREIKNLCLPNTLL